MFSLFHKDSATLAEQKPGDQTRTGVQQPGLLSIAGVTQAPSAVRPPPRPEADARRSRSRRRRRRRCLARTAMARRTRQVSAVRIVTRRRRKWRVATRRSRNRCRLRRAKQRRRPARACRGREKRRRSSRRMTTRGSADTEPVKEERETPVRLTGRRKRTLAEGARTAVAGGGQAERLHAPSSAC